jgi:uncharacterized protein (DUF2132 family)
MANDEYQEPKDESGHLIRELHGVTLATVLEKLVNTYGWVEMSSRIRINCFAVNPSLKSSLTFLRRTPWARKKVEELYIELREAEVEAAAAAAPKEEPPAS